MKTIKALSVVVALVVFSFKHQLRAAIMAGVLLQTAIQQGSYHAWGSPQSGVGWPLAQFLSLRYVVALRLGCSRKENQGRKKPLSPHH